MRDKEYERALLAGDMIQPTHDREGMENTGYFYFRPLFEAVNAPRLSRWSLHEWLAASGFHHGGDLPLCNRVLEIPFWARERRCQTWTSYTSNYTAVDDPLVTMCRYFFRSTDDAEAFGEWLNGGKSYRDRPKMQMLRKPVEYPF